MRRPRRVLGLVLLSLGLGVLTTYAVAWGISLSRDASLLGSRSYGLAGRAGAEWKAMIGARGGLAVVFAYSADPRRMGLDVGIDAEVGRVEVPRWSVVRTESPAHLAVASGVAESGEETLWERATGWPMLAVVDRQIDDNLGGARAAVKGHDLSLRFDGLPEPWTETTIAFLPIWRGFVIDVAVFGSVWMLVIVGVKWVVCRRRVAAGRCAKCRYDLKGLTSGVCPECGSAVKGT